MTPEHSPADTTPTINQPDTEFPPVTLLQWLVLFGVATTTFAIDHLTKWIIVQSLEVRETWVPLPFLENIFDITYIRNTGAAFGLAQRFGNVFLVIAIVVTGVIIHYYRRLPHNYWILRIALGMMMGGALGNAADRVIRGYVVDMFHLHGWPIFNIADSVVVMGVLIWVIVLWWEDRPKSQPTTEAESASDTEALNNDAI